MRLLTLAGTAIRPIALALACEPAIRAWTLEACPGGSADLDSGPSGFSTRTPNSAR